MSVVILTKNTPTVLKKSASDTSYKKFLNLRKLAVVPEFLTLAKDRGYNVDVDVYGVLCVSETMPSMYSLFF